MQEISSQVYIDNSYMGVTLGVVSCEHGLVLIDSPFRAEDVRSWRASLLNLSSPERLLVNLDGHFDRTLGVRAMDCTVVAHHKVADLYHSRPVTFKAQVLETGAEWEMQEGLGSIRWSPPEITFSQEMQIHWDRRPVLLEHRPGSAAGAIWVHLPEDKVLFVGDLVVPAQPPFISTADLQTWIGSLNMLLTPEYQGYLVISGRGGLVNSEQIRGQISFLEKVVSVIDPLPKDDLSEDLLEKAVDVLLKEFTVPAERELQYRRRLRWGIRQYLNQNIVLPIPEEVTEE